MDELNLWARDDLRSLNAQIEFLLREAVRKHRTRKVAMRNTEEDAARKHADGQSQD
jgi:hypothetical protein